jgi:[acyl-carrier-protein] S-malonyltransferase
VARAVFEEADYVLGFPISRLCFEGPEEQLKLTENTQPALLTVSIAAWSVLREQGFKPDYVAGHSLGEYSALVAAGALQIRGRAAPGAQARPLHAGGGAPGRRRHGRAAPVCLRASWMAC